MSKKTRKKSSGTALGGASGKATLARSPASAAARNARSLGKTAADSGKGARKSIESPRPESPRRPASRPSRSPTTRRAGESNTAARPPALTEGERAPAFHLPRDGGGSVSLGDFSNRRLVLFFYPRADTPGCTREAIDFTRLASAFAEHRTAILGISADPTKAQEAFRDKHTLVTPLASDESHHMLEAYGAWGEKSMYGRKFQGVLRTTLLIGEDGRIIRIWRNVKVDGHADDVLAAVRAL